MYPAIILFFLKKSKLKLFQYIDIFWLLFYLNHNLIKVEEKLVDIKLFQGMAQLFYLKNLYYNNTKTQW